VAHQTVIIWGSSGHALVVADILSQQKEVAIAGMIDDFNRDRHGTLVEGIPVLGGREYLDQAAAQGVTHVVFGFGDCAARLQLAAVVEAKGLSLATAIHPRATVAGNSRVGPGAVVAAGAVIGPRACLDQNVIVNTCASVDHECHIEAGAHIGPGARLGGLVTVAAAAWLGIGAIVLDRIHIGAGSIVGAGAVVTKDVPAGVVAYGVPARVVCSVAEHAAKSVR
jgi:acetyltransferase EpsM